MNFLLFFLVVKAKPHVPACVAVASTELVTTLLSYSFLEERQQVNWINYNLVNQQRNVQVLFTVPKYIPWIDWWTDLMEWRKLVEISAYKFEIPDDLLWRSISCSTIYPLPFFFCYYLIPLPPLEQNHKMHLGGSCAIDLNSFILHIGKYVLSFKEFIGNSR